MVTDKENPGFETTDLMSNLSDRVEMAEAKFTSEIWLCKESLWILMAST